MFKGRVIQGPQGLPGHSPTWPHDSYATDNGYREIASFNNLFFFPCNVLGPDDATLEKMFNRVVNENVNRAIRTDRLQIRIAQTGVGTNAPNAKSVYDRSKNCIHREKYRQFQQTRK